MDRHHEQVTVNINLNITLPPSIERLLGRVADTLHTLKELAMSTKDAVDNLKTQVADEQTVLTSAIQLLNGLHQALEDALGSPNLEAAITDLATTIQQNKQDLAAAVVANTPASPTPTPTPAPAPAPEPGTTTEPAPAPEMPAA